MATDWTQTRLDLATAAHRKLGILDPGESLPGQEYTDTTEALDSILKSLHAHGVLWFKVGTPASQSLVADTATVALPADFLFPLSCVLEKSGEQIPLRIVSFHQYQERDRSSTGQPSQVAFQGGNAYFWDTPEQAYTARLTYQAKVDNATDDLTDIPGWAMRPLKIILAAEIADEYGVPEPQVRRLMAERAEALRDIRKMANPRTSPRARFEDF